MTTVHVSSFDAPRHHKPAATTSSWRLTPQERHEIVRAYERGEKGAVIADRYGVDDSYPAKLAKSRGVKKRRAARCCPHCGGAI